MQPPDLTADLAAYLDRQAAIALTGIDHRGQVEYRPAVATQAVGRKLVLVAVEAGEGAEVDHGPMVGRHEAHLMSRIATASYCQS